MRLFKVVVDKHTYETLKMISIQSEEPLRSLVRRIANRATEEEYRSPFGVAIRAYLPESANQYAVAHALQAYAEKNDHSLTKRRMSTKKRAVPCYDSQYEYIQPPESN